MTDRQQARLIARAVRRALSPWLTEAEAADFLAISRTTLRKLTGIKTGYVGRRRRFWRASLEAAVTTAP